MDMAVATGGPSHYAVHWEHPLDVPFIVHDLPFREPMSGKFEALRIYKYLIILFRILRYLGAMR